MEAYLRQLHIWRQCVRRAIAPYMEAVFSDTTSHGGIPFYASLATTSTMCTLVLDSLIGEQDQRLLIEVISNPEVSSRSDTASDL